MKTLKAYVLMGSLLIGTGVAAHAQRDWGHDHDNRGNQGWHDRDNDGDHDRDHDRDWDKSNQKAFRDGYKDGQKDARKHNRQQYRNRYRDNDDRRAYEAGYRRGLGDSGYYGNRGAYPNGPYNNGNNGPYNNGTNQGPYNHPFGGVLAGQNGQYGNNRGVNLASQNGYSDGYLAGQKDRSTGHSFRPTENKGYKDADRGQSQSGISSDQFKQAYRSAFQQGYQRGYNGR